MWRPYSDVMLVRIRRAARWCAVLAVTHRVHDLREEADVRESPHDWNQPEHHQQEASEARKVRAGPNQERSHGDADRATSRRLHELEESHVVSLLGGISCKGTATGPLCDPVACAEIQASASRRSEFAVGELFAAAWN